jgi:predicted CXXCH cytochrome family protein
MKPALRVVLGSLAALLSGCSESDDDSGPPPSIAITGTVMGRGALPGATVALVDAAGAAGSGSLEPVEDLAATSPFQAVTDASGAFSIAAPPGRYFILASPPAGDSGHAPGGEHARRSLEVTASGVAPLRLELSRVPSPAATHVGSSRCLGCHGSLASNKGTLHAVGLRKLGPAGPEPGTLQDVSAFPGRDAALASFADGSAGDNTGPGDGFGLRIAGAAYNVLLGRDATGFFQALESLDGSRVSSPLYVEFTYGGEGLFRQLFATRLDASGAPTTDPTQASRYLLPGQFNETSGDSGRPNEVTVPGWTLFEPESWAPPAVNGGPPASSPVPSRSFDARCSGCHLNGMSLTRNGAGLFQARAVPDAGGGLDYDGNGSTEEINVGCESCHGPGSEHVAQGGGGPIVHPGRLASGAAGLVCGRCHGRGTGNGTIGGEGGSEYPSRNGPGGFELASPAVRPPEFFGQPSGAGILPNFGTQGGFFNPIDLRTDANSWQDAAQGFGARRDHSRGSMQHYLDHARSRHGANESLLLACWDCHHPHARQVEGQLREPATNNVLCLRCHAGQDDFAQVTAAMVDDLASSGTSAPEMRSAVHEHVKFRTFDLVSVSMNLSPDIYGNPAGSDQLGRCITCHMPKTARSGSWVLDDEGFVIRGDISSHSFDNLSPDASEGMAAAGLDPVPNSCVECHRGTLRGAWPDYRFQAGN